MKKPTPLGQVAYEAYVSRVPAVLPAWSELNGIERNVWTQVARASIEASKKAALSRVR
jgi:hypothetical protein